MNSSVFLKSANQRSTDESAYTQLTQHQRYPIHAFMKTGFTQSAVKSAENKANGDTVLQAHQKAMMHLWFKSKNRIASATWDLVDGLIKQDLSPEQISGRLFTEQDISLSHERIYLPIY